MTTKINLVVAHTLEARPLIKYLGLRQTATTPPLYVNEDGIRLIVSGEGQHCAWQAVNYLAELDGTAAIQAWLNIGIAGHQSMNIAQILLANKIVSRRSGEAVFPTLILPALQKFGELHTVDEPERQYPENVAYDMEAFAFFKAASAISTVELIHCFKIISDNKQNSVDTLIPARVKSLMESALGEIREVVAELQQLQGQVYQWQQSPPELEFFLDEVHLTVTQQTQLLRLCQRYYALGMKSELQKLTCSRILTSMDGRELIGRLQSKLAGPQ
ncbi:MAG: hypothetical protein OXD01_13980 [Gammaproteobacteria bacterium]|nr:hypothetical protein [Gammaproteobacteria bacterium]